MPGREKASEKSHPMQPLGNDLLDGADDDSEDMAGEWRPQFVGRNYQAKDGLNPTFPAIT